MHDRVERKGKEFVYNHYLSVPFHPLVLDPEVGIGDFALDKWCAMMWPRLRLLHELLAENGSLWVTIDDNASVLTNDQVFDYIDIRREFVVSKVQGLVLLVQEPCNFET